MFMQRLLEWLREASRAFQGPEIREPAKPAPAARPRVPRPSSKARSPRASRGRGGS